MSQYWRKISVFKNLMCILRATKTLQDSNTKLWCPYTSVDVFWEIRVLRQDRNSVLQWDSCDSVNYSEDASFLVEQCTTTFELPPFSPPGYISCTRQLSIGHNCIKELEGCKEHSWTSCQLPQNWVFLGFSQARPGFRMHYVPPEILPLLLLKNGYMTWDGLK